jgi:23S rRNA (cytosine1962-C5)-methyltransferase
VLNTYLSREAAQKLRHGAFWLRREDILSMDGTPVAGEPVQLRDEEGQVLGLGDVDLESSFPVRRLGLPEEAAEGLIPRHIRHALERRARLVDDPRFCRLVNDDGDGLPGLIVDRYDSPRRRALGLEPKRPHVLYGNPPRWCRLLELGARFTVDLTYGLNTGYHYDQREVRRFLARLARDARVLDPCCNVGGLFVHAGLHGARQILAFDADPDAADLARENAEANGLLGRVKVEPGTTLDVLKAVTDTFDLVLLDARDADSPESFIEHARLALRRTRHGGKLLLTGYHPPLPLGTFEELVAEACEREQRVAFRLARLGLPPDHPSPVNTPAADYLDAVALEVN